jgi:hypothetical protein
MNMTSMQLVGEERIHMSEGMKIHKTNQGETMVPYSHRMMALKWQV